ncbi:GNAT family N-acetyltransferase [Aeromicrobium sp. 636]|uniref:GNAT family N-acetyltransferase n=1 Tax=Aeromicrobium senzhongii TaxID=2663859 RepID=A0A8I0ESW6_9ACTN|nr:MULTISPECIES: GNAT family N-acetyltransferase [Aeromicrobium]MBC9224802.1 GNAT family N-acetyltransferase [Aeromicrobium senzhongii]MCQ3996915.1 GNAT family N-acetyltransferase [Aeromicrobium sp. 636]MTB86849.1 GNAT family N-acetyltransferase [Aeromicrobium senzhongii]QNL93313.1 GNAT family N-acetyltransferase [Aeromicrobium senzhongii]
MFAFRAATEADLPLFVRWRSRPHVLTWFPDPVPDLAAARDRFGGRLAGRDPVRLWIAELGGAPIGYLQSFEVAADDDLTVRCQDPDAVAFDYLIGEPELIDRGLGSEMIDRFCRDVLVPQYPRAPRFLAAPDARNHRSLRVLAKCGFTAGLWIQPEGAPWADIVCTARRERFE